MSEMLEKARKYEFIQGQQIKEEERPAFHITPYVGWMNDPNGFSYYNGAYQAAFDKLVEEFNNSAGKDLGIYAEEMPDLFSAYTDSALGLQKDGLLTDLNQYCSSVLLYLVLRSKRS